MTVKVRPFAERIEGIRPGATLELRGFARGEAFIVALLDREFELQARGIHSDERGTYALVDEAEQRLDFGAVLRVAHEYEPDMPPGGEIEIRWEQFSRERWDTAARALGIDAERVNLIVPARRSVSVSFDHDGIV